jgi:hypothetical protein
MRRASPLTVEYLTTSKPDAPSTGNGIPSHPSSKLFVSKDKMRLETHGLTGTILLLNGGEHTAIALFPAKKEFFVAPQKSALVAEKESSREIFIEPIAKSVGVRSTDSKSPVVSCPM